MFWDIPQMTPYHKKCIIRREQLTLLGVRLNFLSEGVRCDLDKEIAPDGTYLTYFPFGAMIERPQMTPYHKKLLH